MKEEDPNWLMGVKLTDDCCKCMVTLSQTQYVELLLKQFHMEMCNPVSTPMDPGIVLTKANCPKSDKEKEEMSRYPYCEALGSITWLTVMSCPDLTYATSQLGQYSANPGKTHWKALMCILKYLQGTQDLALTLSRVSDADLDPDVITGHTDTSRACDANDHCSTSGYIFQLGDAVILWNSKEQSNIATHPKPSMLHLHTARSRHCGYAT